MGKFVKYCLRRHENKLCENEGCEGHSCLFRHPRKCRYFLQYKYCKFGSFCKFKHEAIENHKEIEELKQALDTVKLKIAEKDQEIKAKENEIASMEEIKEKNRNLETENKELKIKVKELQSDLETTRNDLAVNDMLRQDFKERIRDKYGYDSNDSESDYESDEEIRIKNRLIFRLKKAEELRKKIKCDVCEFTTKSEIALKTHKTKKHKDITG